MFTFLTGFLGGAAFASSYVLLTTPRSGEENQRAVKNYVNDVKVDSDYLQDKISHFQASLDNFNAEVSKLQMGVVPEVMSTINDFSTDADVYTRRIKDSINDIQYEVDDLKTRINRENEQITISDDEPAKN